MLRKLFPVLLILFLFSMAFSRTVVTFMTQWTGPEYQVIASMAEKFNSIQDEYEVKILSVSNIAEKFLTSLAAGNPPDILHANDQYVAPLVAMGAIEPINDIEKYGVNLDEYRKEALEAIKYKGDLYGIPIKLDIFGIFWNKDLFKKAGLDPDNPPTSLNELMEYAKKLTEYDQNGDIKTLGFDPGYNDKWTWPHVWPYYFGGSLIDKDGKITANAPECVEAYKWFQKLSELYGTKDMLEKFVGGYGPYWSASNQFVSERVVITFSGDWLAKIIDLYNPEMNWGFAPFPSKDEKPRAYTEIDIAVIPKGAKHVDGAKKFLAFVSKPENTLKFLVPVSVLKEDYVNKYRNAMISFPHRDLFQKIAGGVRLFFAPATPVWQEYLTHLTTAFLDVLFLRTTPIDALNDVQKKVSKALKMMSM